MPHYLLTILATYLLGCFTTGYYLVRLTTGRDIRLLASGTAGSRNAGRILGGWGFVVTFLGDAGKGMLAVWLATRVGADSLLPLLALLAATCGHIWPVQLRFQGGKGLATFAGGLALLQPLVLALCLGLCAGLYLLWRSSQRAGLVALAGSPLMMGIVLDRQSSAPLPVWLGLYTLLVAMILYAHRVNIRKEFLGSFRKGEAHAERVAGLQDRHGTGGIRTDSSSELPDLCRRDPAAPREPGEEAGRQISP